MILDISKNNLLEAKENEEFISKYLEDDNVQLKYAALYCILFRLRIQKNKYKERGIFLAKDINEFYNVRIWAIAGLGMAYENTNDKTLLDTFLKIIFNENDEISARVAAFENIFNLYSKFNYSQKVLSMKRKNDQHNYINCNLKILSNDLDEISKFIGYTPPTACQIKNEYKDAG